VREDTDKDSKATVSTRPMTTSAPAVDDLPVMYDVYSLHICALRCGAGSSLATEPVIAAIRKPNEADIYLYLRRRSLEIEL